MPSRIKPGSKGLAVVSVIVGVFVSCWIRPMSCARADRRVNRYVAYLVTKSALVGAFARGDLLDQLDDTAAHFGVRDARERARQRQAFGSCEKIGNIRGR